MSEIKAVRLPGDCKDKRVEDISEPYIGGIIMRRTGDFTADIRWDDGTTTLNSINRVNFKIVND